jgi:hypothetical protein
VFEMAENNEKEYLDSLGLIRLVANIINKFATKTEIKAEVDSLKSGDIVVKEAEHADTSDTAGTADFSTNAGHASTADIATNATNAEHAESANTATNANHANTSTNATNAENANHAVSADTATNANHATTADSATTATTATNANHATSADSATNANHATTAGSATTAENANHATSADTATNATTADKVSKTLTVQLNGGTTEGADKFTYNGSAVKSFNITPGNIGAYTKGEVDSALSGKASDTHNHDDKYDAKNTASNAVSSHNTNTSAHNDIRLLISELSSKVTGFLNINDEDFDTLSELIAYIEANRESIESFTTGKVNVSDIINNLTTNVSNKPLSAAQGVALKSLIDALDSAVDSKASSSDLTSHTGNNTIHITSGERDSWNATRTKVDGIAAGAEVNVQSDWNENDSTSDAYVKNRPFYTGEPVLITVVNNVTFTMSNYNGLGAAQNPFTLELVEGTEYIVTWNGTDYTTTCTMMDGLLAIGNGSIFGMGQDTGAPFLIGYSGSIMLYANKSGSATVTIKRNDAEVHKINNKYIDFPEGSNIGASYNGVGEIFNDYNNNIASGNYSHAEGSNTTASGHWSHAEGYHTKAIGGWSHAEGYATKAHGQAQHVQGKFNVEDTAETYAHIVGNGSSDANASNAHTLDWDGNAWYAGTVKVGGTSYSDAKEVATKDYVDDLQADIDAKADKATTLSGYGITDAASKEHGHKIADVTGLQSALDAMDDWLVENVREYAFAIDQQAVYLSSNGISTLAAAPDAGVGATVKGIVVNGELYNFEPYAHEHSTASITTGTLGVARGGTGKATHTSNAILTGNGTSAVKNVATANGAFYATSTNGAAQFGTLPIAQGGTGATSASAARTNLSVYSKAEVDEKVGIMTNDMIDAICGATIASASNEEF